MREQAKATLARLARKVEPRAKWSDLRLTAAQEQTLREVCLDAHERATIRARPATADQAAAASGVAVLLVGGDTGARLVAAEVAARDLHLDLYRVDLSRVVSKYIGETEKNMQRIFDAAEHLGVILFFDEADALFGKRTEVKDSHDRYANLDVSFLLARIEASTGLVILATNFRATEAEAESDAVLRRIRYVVDLAPPSRRPPGGGPR